MLKPGTVFSVVAFWFSWHVCIGMKQWIEGTKARYAVEGRPLACTPRFSLACTPTFSLACTPMKIMIMIMGIIIIIITILILFNNWRRFTSAIRRVILFVRASVACCARVHHVGVCTRAEERSCPTPPHPTPPVTDHERAVPVSAREQERWWGCGACVCTGTWALLSHPAPPHPTPNNDESAVMISRMRDDEGAQVSDILLTGCASEWGRASEWNFGCASEGLALWSTCRIHARSNKGGPP